jgi:hypothetical protein
MNRSNCFYSIVVCDLVTWYTFGCNDVVRAEDWPVMPVETIGFRLQPVQTMAEVDVDNYLYGLFEMYRNELTYVGKSLQKEKKCFILLFIVSRYFHNPSTTSKDAHDILIYGCKESESQTKVWLGDKTISIRIFLFLPL